MKSKTSKYAALAIIIIGIIFIYFIPSFNNKKSSVDPNNWPELSEEQKPDLHCSWCDERNNKKEKFEVEKKSSAPPISIQVNNKISNFKEIIRTWIINPVFGRSSKYAGIDGELKELFKEAEVIYLIDDIKLVDSEKKHTRKKMYGTIVGIINNNNYPIRYKIGDKEYIEDWYTGSSDVIVPEGALLFLQWGNNYIHNAGNTVYFNYGQVGRRYNGYTFEHIKAIFDKANDK